MTTIAAPMAPSRAVVAGLLILVALAQALVMGYTGGRQVAWLMWSALLMLIASGIALQQLLKVERLRAHGPVLAAAAAIALWLGIVQFSATVPEFGFRSTWMWWSALLLVPVARLAWQQGFALVLLVALILPAGFHALWLASIALTHPMGYVGLGHDPNVLADRIVLLFLLAMAGAAIALRGFVLERTTSAALLGLLGLAAACALLIQQGLNARAGMALLVAAAAILAVIQRDWRLGLLPLLMLVVYALPWLFPEWATIRQSGSAARLSLAALEQDLGTGSTRDALRAAAWSMLPLAGFTGLGFGGFALLYPQMREAGDGTHGVLVHNDYLQLLVEAGPPMLVALLAFALLCGWSWCRVAWQLWTRTESAAPRRDLILAQAALLGVGVVLAHAFINFPLFDAALLNITLVAGVIGISVAYQGSPAPLAAAEPSDNEGQAARPLRLASFAALGLLGLMWLQAGGHVLAQVTLSAQHSPFPGVAPLDLSAQQRARWAERLQALGVGYGMPAFSQAHLLAVMRAERGGDLPEAVERFAVDRFEAALAGSPYNEMIYVQYAAFLQETGRGSVEERIALLERGLERRPMGPQLWWALAYHRNEGGQWEPVARAMSEEWFRVCRFAAYNDLRAARGFYDLIPESVRAAHPEEIARCRGAIDRVVQRTERYRALQQQAAAGGAPR